MDYQSELKRPKKIINEEDIWEGSSGEIRKNIILYLYKTGEVLKMNELFKIFNSMLKSRGALRYHLNILIKYGFILPLERDNSQKGRPTYIRLNLKNFKKEKMILEDKIKKSEEEFKNSPITKEILHILSKKSLDSNLKLNQMVKENLTLDIYSNIIFQLRPLINEGYVKEEYKITPKGRKFLKKIKSNSLMKSNTLTRKKQLNKRSKKLKWITKVN